MSKKQKTKPSTVLLYLPLVFLSLLILMNFYLGLNKAFTHNPVPKLWGFAPLVVLSGSMEPTIHPGDLVLIRAQKAEQYKVGDIATYLEGRTAYTHRIVGLDGGLFILKGDSNNAADDKPIRPEQFEGKVFLTVPKAGLAIVFFRKPAGMAVLALLVFLFIFGEDLFAGAKKELHRRKGKRGGEGGGGQ